ncbi:MAG: hypothetical protein GX748_02500, partial [Lentisphaerae bacterium]|nr:hypothetical protein [Lentisphaerota bacterium]
MQRFKDTTADLDKRKVPFDARIAEMNKLLQEPEFRDDAATRYALLRQIILYTQTPPWTRIGLYDYETIHEALPPAADAILADPDFSSAQKLDTAIYYLVQYHCDYDRFAEAEATARRGMELPDLKPGEQAKARLILADVRRYQDRYDEALAVVREVLPLNPVMAARKGAAIAFDFGKPEDAAALWKAVNDPYEELMFYEKHRGRDDRSAQARAYVMVATNDATRRFNVAAAYCFGDMKPENVAARKLIAGIAAEKKMKGFGPMNAVKQPFRMGDYPLTLSLCEVYAGSPVMEDLNIRNIQVISLGAVGRRAEAATLAGEYAKDEKLKPVDQTRFKFYEAILAGKSTDDILPAAKLTRKEESAVILSAARQCLSVWNLTDLAERYAAYYERYFAEKPERRIEVVYFDTPVKNITAWRAIYPKLEKQYCDIPYKGSMAFLETDVATGERNVQIDKDAKPVNTLELTALCDRYGVHLFLRAEDANARAIEQGFARGIGTEMYFAPGENQPYTCLGSAPAAGVTFLFHTTYNNRNATRLDKQQPRTSFHSDVEFTETDYVLHLCFAWDSFYNKLPAAGTDWRFDCLAWTPAGGFSWGGSQGIHSASAWGNLRFTLTPPQLNAIRREILFKTYRSYKQVPRDPGVRENLFQCWKDPEIGDPEFYTACLAPLEKELDAYAALVKADMGEAEVAKVYSEALPRWKGLAHEVDECRRRYLAEQFTASGR